MTQPSRMLYLPPGVMPPAQPVALTAGGPSGIPFDRSFFEKVLPQAVAVFCEQAGCTQPLVELLTIDGVTHFVNGISGVSDAWVALQTSDPDHDHARQVFLPYQTIFRVEVHPAEDERRRRLGFVISPATMVLTPPLAPAAPVARKKPAGKARK